MAKKPTQARILIDATKAQLAAELRKHMIFNTERGRRVIGHGCWICNTRWRGLKEKHKSNCVLRGTNRESTS